MQVASSDDHIDWSGIQTAAAIVGIREAARRAAINSPPEDQPAMIERIRKRAYREGWKVKTDAIVRQASTTIDSETGEIVQNAMSPIVPTGKDIIDTVLADDARETKLSLSRAARKGAKAAETLEGVDVIKSARNIGEVGKLANLLHGYDRSGAGVSVNVNLLCQNVGNLHIQAD